MVVTLLERAYAGAKSLLALIGLTALAGALLVPLSGDGMGALAVFGQDGLFEPATTVAGPIQAPVESPLEREQRSITEYIARRYRVSDAAVAGRADKPRARA